MEEAQDHESKTNPVRLTDITRGLYHAASSTYSMVAKQYENLLDHYFSKDHDGAFIAKTIEVQLPDESTVSLPLISLVTPKGLMLEKVDFDFSVKVDPTTLIEVKDGLSQVNLFKTDPGDSHLTRSAFQVEMAARPSKEDSEEEARKPGIMDVSMKFRAIEPPEGLMRLIDKFTSSVTPIKPLSHTSAHLSLLSPKLFFIAQALKEDADLAETLREFNEAEYTSNYILDNAQKVKNWESDLLKISIEIDQIKTEVAEEFKETFLYARIVFKGTADFERLMLNKKINTRVRDWASQAFQFYDTILENEGLAFKLSRLKMAEFGSLNTQWTHEFEKVKTIRQKLEEYDDFKGNNAVYKDSEEWLQRFNAVCKFLLRERPDQLAKLFPDSEFFNK